ncbi:hypothetical protein PybrP1_009065 [[Pythium] brassicae (nom. inval.)]|nr:hypothetical protein PybrP1_009065 [[Pythium] brassicae (nom. inval.)]
MAMRVATTARGLRVMTWNINGLRAVLQREKTKLAAMLEDLDADVVCFQETKLTRSELDEELVRVEGFDAFYSFCRVRGGYSGVVTFVRTGIPTPRAEEGLTGAWKTETSVGHVGDLHREFEPKLVSELEAEGRCVITDHEAFVLLNVYCPAVRNSERLEFKLAFHQLLQDRVRALQRAGKFVVVVGDINIAHREIDHCEPSASEELAFGDHPCRRWMDAVLYDVDVRRDSLQGIPLDEREPGRLVDSFRYFHPLEAKAYTCWNTKTGARQTNFGTRIDYILVDPELMSSSVTDCVLQPDRLGSDHCPVVLSGIVQLTAADARRRTTPVAALCARNFVEFAGKQQDIKAFFPSREQLLGAVGAIPPGTSDCTSSAKLFSSVAATATTAVTVSSTPPRLRKRVVGKPSGSSSKPSQPSIRSFFGQSATPKAAAAVGPLVASQALQPLASGDESDVDVEQLLQGLERKRHAAQERQLEWRRVLSGEPPRTPLCFCQQPTVLRTVLKSNDNWGRKFFVCTKPAGEKGHPDARCEFFQWADDRSSKRPKTTTH